jgi:hypothetical protein
MRAKSNAIYNLAVEINKCAALVRRKGIVAGFANAQFLQEHRHSTFIA